VATRWRGVAAGLRSVGRELGRAEKKEGGGEKESRPRVEKKTGPSPRAARERVFLFFLFSVSLLKTNLFQNIFKTKFKFLFKL